MAATTLSIKAYVTVFVWLMVLLGLTIAAALLPLGPLEVFVAFGIAVIKAVLVVLYFMHLRYSSPLVHVVVGASILWLFILFALTASDYLTRGQGLGG
jgi:cytochrome c oxidase subunit 4